jgi:prepilin-type processing-associated H-X9-DG protein
MVSDHGRPGNGASGICIDPTTGTYPNGPYGGPRIAAAHNGGTNAGFADGHVKYMNAQDQLYCYQTGAISTTDPLKTAQRHFWLGTD